MFSYRKNAQRLARMIAKKPMSAEERIVKYAEFAAKFGNDNNLDMYGRHLNFVQYYCLDIIVPVLIIFGLFVCLILKFLSLILRKIFGKGKTKTKKE